MIQSCLSEVLVGGRPEVGKTDVKSAHNEKGKGTAVTTTPHTPRAPEKTP